jgi:AraC-like DNA-binding protein
VLDRRAPGGARGAARYLAPCVAALVVNRQARARIRDAIPAATPVEIYERAADLLDAVRSGSVLFVILEPRDAAGTLTDAVARVICEGYPTVPVIAYGAPSPFASRDILALARAGVHELVLRGLDDVGIALRAALASATRRRTADHVMREIGPLLTAPARALVRYFLEHAERAPTVSDVARALGVHRKTLVNRLRSARLPPPSSLLGWCRLFVAARLLEDPMRPVEQVAHELDFPSGAALRNMLRRYTGLRPQDVREVGGIARVLDAFRRSIGRLVTEPTAELECASPAVAHR